MIWNIKMLCNFNKREQRERDCSLLQKVNSGHLCLQQCECPHLFDSEGDILSSMLLFFSLLKTHLNLLKRLVYVCFLKCLKILPARHTWSSIRSFKRTLERLYVVRCCLPQWLAGAEGPASPICSYSDGRVCWLPQLLWGWTKYTSFWRSTVLNLPKEGTSGRIRAEGRSLGLRC